jgi:competence protein ComEA
VEPSPTPWRVLDDAPASAAAPKPAAGAGAAVPRSAWLAGAAAVAFAVAALGLAVGSGSSGTVEVEGAASFAIAGSGSGSAGSGDPGGGPGRAIVVEVEGAVTHPGVFRLGANARVGDLIAAAGGYGPRVDTRRAARELNLAAPLHDGERILVPSRDDPDTSTGVAGGGMGEAPSGSGGTAAGTSLVHLNRATVAELDALPGIGPVTAAKIVASREAGTFTSVEDLRTRKLVGAKVFEQVKTLVAVP